MHYLSVDGYTINKDQTEIDIVVSQPNGWQYKGNLKRITRLKDLNIGDKFRFQPDSALCMKLNIDDRTHYHQCIPLEGPRKGIITYCYKSEIEVTPVECV